MTKRAWAFGLIAFIAAAGRGWGQEENPLKPLAEIDKHLSGAIEKFLAGASSVEAFKPWTVKGSSEKSEKRIRDEFKAAGGVKVVNAGLELEFLFYAGEKAVYYLRTYVHPSGGDLRFLGFSGRVPTDGKTYVSGFPFERCTGTAKPFAEAGQAVLKMLKTENAKVLFVDTAKLKSLFASQKGFERVVRSVEKAEKGLAKTLKELRELKADKVSLRVDDQDFFALNDAGQIVGTLRGDLGVGKDGNVEYKLKGFRAWKNR